MGYAFCRVLVNAVVHIYYGGQAIPKIKTNIVIPPEQYEYTRGYLNQMSALNQNLS